jgi:undecaprenyl-diphosphatase
VLIYFRHDIWDILKEMLEGIRQRDPLGSTNARLGWYIAVGSIPAGVAGLLLEDSFKEVFGNPTAAAFFLIVTAGLLVVAERLLTGKKMLAEMSWLDAIIIGLFQMLALLPGISRSGSTITAGIWRGLEPGDGCTVQFLAGGAGDSGRGSAGSDGYCGQR